jgi:polyphenol oxidase
MVYQSVNGLELGFFKNLSKYQDTISHFVTTRAGGTSKEKFHSLNLSLNQNDIVDNVLENRKRLANAMNIGVSDFVFPVQVHKTYIPRIYESDRGKGALSASDAFQNTDGIVTNVKRLCLITLAADCVPIILFDPICNAIAVAHAGWKGTVLKIPAEAVKRMTKEFGTNPSDLIVGIGPSGGSCCYEVGSDVIDEVSAAFDKEKVIKNVSGKTIFDMWEANRITLTEIGVNPVNIEIAGICTICNSNKFFSARNGDDGRFVAGIFLR